MFLSDPVLSKLNQRPSLNGARSVAENPNLIHMTLDGIPQNNTDSVHRVNMWNPIVSAPKARQSSGNSHPELRNTMQQKPFRKPSYDQYPGARSSFGKTVKIVQDMREREKYTSRVLEKKDYFHPVKKIKLSITKLNNAVSFCSTQVEMKDSFPVRKNNSAKVSDSSSERFTRSAHRSLRSDPSVGHEIEINLAKGKIYENPSISRKSSSRGNRNSEISALNSKLFADSHDVEELQSTGDLVKASKNLKDIVKHVYFSNEKNDEVNLDVSNVNHSDCLNDRTQANMDNNSDVVKRVWFCDDHNNSMDTIEKQVKTRKHNDVNKIFECPPELEPALQNAEVNIVKSKMFDCSPEKDVHTIEYDAMHNNGFDRKGFTGKIFENSGSESVSRMNIFSGEYTISDLVNSENKLRDYQGTEEHRSKMEKSSRENKSRSDQNTKENKSRNDLSETGAHVQGLKPKFNLPKPSFGLPGTKDISGQGTHTPKLKKGQPAKTLELICSTVSLQYKQPEASNWRLNILTQNGEIEREDCEEILDDRDIKASILKGSKITVETDTSKDPAQTAFDPDVQTPRSSQKSYSGKVNKRKVKKTALASGVMTTLWYPCRMM